MKTTLTVHPKFTIGEISPLLFGGFLEPIGPLVNGSMYNPKHPSADGQGFRQDFYTALKEAGLPCIRLPGGNYVSGWSWKDSIGPKEQRKRRPDLAWRQTITNEVGLDEYLQWAEKTGAEALYTINLGTEGIKEARDLIEYTNLDGNTYWSDLRRANGLEKPYAIKTWYLGNEMDGPWEIGSFERDPRGYGVLCNEVSKVLKWTDPRIKTAVCVSSSPHMGHYPVWEEAAIEQCYESIDYLSLHHYHTAAPGDWKAYLGGSVYYEDYINTEIALADFLQTKFRSPKKLMLSFDEYGAAMRPLEGYLHPGWGKHTLYERHYPKGGGEKAPEFILHDPNAMNYDRRYGQSEMADALSSASILLAFIRHADRVKIGCQTSGIHSLAAADGEHVWKGSAYHVFTHLIRYAKGISLAVSNEGDSFDIPGYVVDNDSQYVEKTGVPWIDAAAAYNAASGELTLFAINRDAEAERCIEIDISAFGSQACLIEHLELHSEDMNASNSFEQPEVIMPKVNRETACKGGKVNAGLQKLSWNVFRIKTCNQCRHLPGLQA
jgi:alpha-N-arabinofuranosidase